MNRALTFVNYLRTPLLFLLCLLPLVAACDLIEYHPYSVDTEGISDVNAAQMRRITASCAGRDTLRFALISDTQRQYDETEELIGHLNRNDSLNFVIHAGDLTDFGLTKEFLWMHDLLSRLRVPYVVLLGNHDVLGNGLQVYRSMFGPENFSFVAGRVRFVCLNTNAIEFDYSTPVPDFSFLSARLEEDAAMPGLRTIVAMHSAPFTEQFNNNVAEAFEVGYVTRFSDLVCCLHGHGHGYEHRDLYGDGVMYYSSPNPKKRHYLVFTVTPDSYSYEVVWF